MHQTTFGQYLRELRKRQGLTQNKLAQMAQVSPRTLTYWESDSFTPREQELKAALDALKISPQEEARLLGMTAGRGEKMFRENVTLTQSLSNMPLPGAGDLLAALRVRKGLPRRETASLLGVSESTLGRWENNRIEIPDSILPQAQTVLKASQREIKALRNRLTLPLEDDGGAFSLARYERQAAEFAARRFLTGVGVTDLDALALQRRFWLQAMEYPEARKPLARVTRDYAVWLVSQNRRGEVRQQAQYALNFYSKEPQTDASLAGVLNLLSWCEAFGPQRKPHLGAKLFQSWLPRLTHPENQIHALADVSLYTAMSGDAELAIRYFRQACRVCEGLREATEAVLHYLQITFARLLLLEGKPQEACAALAPLVSDTESVPADMNLNHALIITEILLSAGERSRAEMWLRSIYSRLEGLEMALYLKKADALAERF